MKSKLSKYVLVPLIFFIVFIFSNPINAFCDNVSTESEKVAGLQSGNLSDYEISTSNFDSGFYIIVITSIIVLGVLFFAMWKTIRGRKQF